MSSRRQRHLGLRERLDLVADDVDATLVGGVQLEHGGPERRPQHVPGQREDCGGLADTGRPLPRHGAVGGGWQVRRMANGGFSQQTGVAEETTE